MHQRAFTQKFEVQKSPAKLQHPMDLVDIPEAKLSPKFSDLVQTAKKINYSENMIKKSKQIETFDQHNDKNKINQIKDEQIQQLQLKISFLEKQECDFQKILDDNYYLLAEQQELNDQIEYWKRKHQNQADQCDVLRNNILKIKEEANQKIRCLEDEINNLEKYFDDQLISARNEIRKLTFDKEKLTEQVQKFQSEQNKLISDFQIEQERYEKKIQLYEQSFNDNEDQLENLSLLTEKLEEANQLNQQLKQRINLLKLNQQELMNEVTHLKAEQRNQRQPSDDVSVSYSTNKKILQKINSFEAQKHFRLKTDSNITDREERKQYFNRSACRF